MAQALNGLSLLVADPVPPLSRSGTIRLRVADWLPALVNASRAFITTAAVAVFWIVTAWPKGAQVVVFAAISIILFAPRADEGPLAATIFTFAAALGMIGRKSRSRR
jgi:uncharacterized membrane protein YccC